MIIKLQKKEIKLQGEKIYPLLIGIYIASVFVFSYDVNKNFISQCIFIIMALACLFYSLNKRHIKIINEAPIFILGIVMLSFLSILWSENKIYALNRCMTVLQLSILSIIIILMIDERKKIESLLKYIIVSGYFMYIYTLNVYGLNGIKDTLLNNMRLGGIVNQENSFGLYSSIIFMIILYQILFINKKIYLFLLPIPIIMAVLSGSRKSGLLLVILFIGMIVLKKKRKKFFRLIFSIIALIIVIFILYKIGIANTLIERIMGNESSADSTDTRILLAKFGIEKFLQNPILGYGIEQYQILCELETGNASPAHNNYIQLAVSFGIIGILLWYGMYYFFLKIGIQYFYQDSLSPLLVFIVILTIINDITTTTLTNKMTYVLIAICFCIVNIIKNNDQIKNDG